VHIRWVIVSAVTLLMVLPSCIQADDGLIPIQLPGGVIIQAEVANTMKKRAEGLMYRESLAKDRGMLFTFDQAQPWTFWMKNTKIPLSAAYINPEGVILEIHALEPENTNSVIAATDQIQYVLETPQGWFERHHVSTGAVVKTELGPLKSSFH